MKILRKQKREYLRYNKRLNNKRLNVILTGAKTIRKEFRKYQLAKNDIIAFYEQIKSVKYWHITHFFEKNQEKGKTFLLYDMSLNK